jgi:Trk-type K+ transport system membrane component
MAGIITVIIILVFSIFITRLASIALTHTGLSRESSRFQARSAFTGVGFTTSESEKVVNHPLRRKILQVLMILGNAGIITAIASLIIGFSGIKDNVDSWLKLINKKMCLSMKKKKITKTNLSNFKQHIQATSIK